MGQTLVLSLRLFVVFVDIVVDGASFSNVVDDGTSFPGVVRNERNQNKAVLTV
jgi:hypothetical protein